MNNLMRAKPEMEEEKEKTRRGDQEEIKIETQREDYGIEIAKLKSWQTFRDERALEEGSLDRK